MTELLTAAQMRAIEQAAIESGEVTGLELMERAGQGVVEAVFEEWPELAKTSHRAVVLCGPGNNGGDGFVVARLLKEWGWEVEVFLYGDAEKLPPDARMNYERWGEIGEVQPWHADQITDAVADLFVDAVFGTGLKRAMTKDLSQPLLYLSMRNKVTTKVVAIDAPSGLCLDSGKALELENEATLTTFVDLVVSFHSAKIGHFLEISQQRCRKVVVKDIGLRHDFTDEHVHQIGEIWLADDPIPMLSKWRFDHKFGNGHAFVLTGGPGNTGAARLAARGALRIGAGLVTLGVPGAAQMEVASSVTAIMIKRAGTEEEVASVLEDTRINAVCLGPGLGLGRARGLVETVLGGVSPPRPTVLDADALSVFDGEAEALFEMLHDGCVLTPHGGEFARLFPDIAERLHEAPMTGPAYSKVDATREAAKRAGCVVLFKGPDTVIAAPDGQCSINSAQYEREAPWLATAGSGDVLAGFITGLLARGFDPMQAAETGAWLHVECARRFGPGLIAEDLPEELPGVFRDLGV